MSSASYTRRVRTRPTNRGCATATPETSVSRSVRAGMRGAPICRRDIRDRRVRSSAPRTDRACRGFTARAVKPADEWRAPIRQCGRDLRPAGRTNGESPVRLEAIRCRPVTKIFASPGPSPRPFRAGCRTGHHALSGRWTTTFGRLIHSPDGPPATLPARVWCRPECGAATPAGRRPIPNPRRPSRRPDDDSGPVRHESLIGWSRCMPAATTGTGSTAAADGGVDEVAVQLTKVLTGRGHRGGEQ